MDAFDRRDAACRVRLGAWMPLIENVFIGGLLPAYDMSIGQANAASGVSPDCVQKVTDTPLINQPDGAGIVPLVSRDQAGHVPILLAHVPLDRR